MLGPGYRSRLSQRRKGRWPVRRAPLWAMSHPRNGYSPQFSGRSSHFPLSCYALPTGCVFQPPIPPRALEGPPVGRRPSAPEEFLLAGGQPDDGVDKLKRGMPRRLARFDVLPPAASAWHESTEDWPGKAGAAAAPARIVEARRLRTARGDRAIRAAQGVPSMGTSLPLVPVSTLGTGGRTPAQIAGGLPKGNSAHLPG